MRPCAYVFGIGITGKLLFATTRVTFTGKLLVCKLLACTSYCILTNSVRVFVKLYTYSLNAFSPIFLAKIYRGPIGLKF